jgi:uncharacterized YccA/Bax inhibitor family protein
MAPQEPHRDEKEPLDMRIISYFVRIMRTMFLGFFWMIINVFLGLFLGFAIPEESTPGRMIFFYSWMAVTLAGYLYVVRRMWRKNENVQDNYK